MIEIILILVLIFSFLFFMYKECGKAEEKRFREFVVAIRAKDLDEYKNLLPEENEKKEEVNIPDEIEDPYSTDPRIFIKALDEDENNKNKH